MLKLFGISIANLSQSETLDRIQGLLVSGGRHLVVTANPEILVEARRNLVYHQALEQASLVLADGTGLIFASYLLRQPLTKGRVVGVDLVERLVAESGMRGYSVFLAGSTQDILQKTTQHLTYKYKNIRVAGSYSALHDPHIVHDSVDEYESQALIKAVSQAKPDILLLAFGHPKQELWLAKHLPELDVKVALGVGGSFDYLSGLVKRAPVFARSLGMEWLWRLAHQPWRWKRIYIAIIVFPWLVIRLAVLRLFHVEQG